MLWRVRGLCGNEHSDDATRPRVFVERIAATRLHDTGDAAQRNQLCFGDVNNVLSNRARVVTVTRGAFGRRTKPDALHPIVRTLIVARGGILMW